MGKASKMTVNWETDEGTVTINMGGEVDEADASLRFFGDDLNPNEITKLLNCQPSYSCKKGDRFKSRIENTGKWFLKIERNKEQNLEEQILQILESLSDDLGVWQNLTQRFKVDIFCGGWIKVWNRRIKLSSDLFKKLSDRGLELEVSIYCECDNDEDDE